MFACLSSQEASWLMWIGIAMATIGILFAWWVARCCERRLPDLPVIKLNCPMPTLGDPYPHAWYPPATTDPPDPPPAPPPPP